MAPAEFHKHRIRAQLIKIIAHLREARMDVNLCEDHVKYVQNASEIEALATLQLDTQTIPHRVEQINNLITNAIEHLVNQADTLRGAMENPNTKPPPIVGRFLSLSGLTRTQREMARDGFLPYTDMPTHQNPPKLEHKPAIPRKLPEVIIVKRKPRKKPRNEMPI